MLHRTLRNYQNSSGIPFEEQIVLVNNQNIFKNFEPVICPYFNVSQLKKILWKFRYRIGNKNAKGNVVLPDQSNNLFLGYFDNSYDFPSDQLKQLFTLIGRNPHRDFWLLVGKGDYCLSEQTLTGLPGNLKGIVANNIDFDHPKIHLMPIGRDFRNLELLAELRPKPVKKTLCYCNFSLDTHEVRSVIYEALVKKDFIDFEHMGKFLTYSVSRQQFLNQLADSKFSVCPRGNAIDTFRLWDSLYAGTIPIVLRDSGFYDQITDLPILFLEDLSEFADLTADYLEDVYCKFLDQSYNYSKLTASYWLNCMRKRP